MNVAVVGSGYVGLVLGACLAESGQHVTCVDKDLRKVLALRRGSIPIYEPGLVELVRRNAAQGRLTFTDDLRDCVGEAQVVFLAVPTPEGRSGEAELKYVLAAAEEVARELRGYTVIVNKSTVPVGTADAVRALVARTTSVEFDVVSNPEFLKEGAALDDFLTPDRVVIGASSERAARVMLELYAPFCSDERPLLFMDNRSAELTKYASNAMLATRISFMNELARLCERVGADVDRVRRGLGSDRRIGPAFLAPGIGYGGSCFPKDVKALMATARKHGLELGILRAVTRANERQKRTLLEKALAVFGDLDRRTFAVWGLSFKPSTDDMREAPALQLIEGLLSRGADVRCHDPVAMEVARRHFKDRVHYAKDPYDALEGADALFLVTEWEVYRKADLDRIRRRFGGLIVFDGRNVFDPAQMRELGFHYEGVGRGLAPPAVEPAPRRKLTAVRTGGAGVSRSVRAKSAKARPEPILAQAHRSLDSAEEP